MQQLVQRAAEIDTRTYTLPRSYRLQEPHLIISANNDAPLLLWIAFVVVLVQHALPEVCLFHHERGLLLAHITRHHKDSYKHNSTVSRSLRPRSEQQQIKIDKELYANRNLYVYIYIYIYIYIKNKILMIIKR
eukprot:gene5908-4223_t